MNVTVPAPIVVLYLSAVTGVLVYIVASEIRDWLDPKVKRWIVRRAMRRHRFDSEDPEDVVRWLQDGRRR